MRPAKTKELCRGCYDDEYNRGLGGADGCWSFASSKVYKRKFVHIDQRPPWNNNPEWTLDCHHKQRFVSVKPEVTR